jgi:nitrous-oxide reductase
MKTQHPISSRILATSFLALMSFVAVSVTSCSKSEEAAIGDPMSIAKARGLSPADVERAVKTFVPPGKYDDYVIFASGGHSGQMHLIGVPSMRLLKTIPVFTNDSWNGYGYGNKGIEDMLDKGSEGRERNLRWGDTHHPALSETEGDYDGRFCYVNDRANGRIGMIDLSDFKTKEILAVPNIQTSHGGVFATPNTEYVHISAKVPKANAFSETPMGLTKKEHMEHYKDIYRGASTWLKIDQKNGRFLVDQSFQIELPPYNQDLADAGKDVSFGWGFINSYNTEMATGGNKDGSTSIESGASKNDFDYLHIINWQKAEEVVKAGKVKKFNGINVISIKTAVEEGILYLAPEPKSPHGVDISPNGNYITVSGKLDPHSTIYGFDLIKKAIAEKNFEGTDAFGIPILRYKAIVAGQVELGAGPLHTQYDDKGNAYTSLFLENAVVKWTLGPPYFSGDKAWKVVDKIPISYNIGHLTTVHGDTRHPQGKYCIAMNKWSIDRHPKIGTLLPQNFQLIDLTGAKMQLLVDMPLGIAEPHYAQTASMKLFEKSLQVYPIGTDPMTMKVMDGSIQKAEDTRIVRSGNTVDVYLSLIRSSFTPDIIEVKRGDKVRIHITNIEQTPDATHGFAIPEYNVSMSLDAGEAALTEFVASKPGSFSMYCTEFCSALHLEMQGWIIVS